MEVRISSDVYACDTRSTCTDGNLVDKGGEGTVKASAALMPPPTLFKAIAETERAAADTKLAVPRLRRLRTMDAGSVCGILSVMLFIESNVWPGDG